MSLILTQSGTDLLLRALAGTAEIHFTHIKLGSGTDAGGSATDLTTPKKTFPIQSITTGDDFAALKIAYNNNDILVGFRCTEIGIFAIDPDNSSASILYAYEYTEPVSADYVPANTDRTLETEITALVFIGEAADVTAEIASGIYALIDHTHNAADIIRGILAAARGGTGGSTGRIVLGQSTYKGYLGNKATAEGTENNSEGENSHASGSYTAAVGKDSFSTGEKAAAIGKDSVALGYENQAIGEGSFVGGVGINHSVFPSAAYGKSSFCFGNNALTIADGSTAIGSVVKAYGVNSFALGFGTLAYNMAMMVLGKYNRKPFTADITSYGYSDSWPLTSGNHARVDFRGVTVEEGFTDDLLVVGSGSNGSTRSNAFRVTATDVYGQTYHSSGADYAELFEWADGNSQGFDRVGLFVTLEGAKLRLATPEDDFVLGVVSGNPSVCADVYDDQWQGMYLRDVYGRPIFEDVFIPEELSEDGEVLHPAHTERRWKLNPDYDDSQTYIPRSLRKEWDAVGMIGKLVAVDDGTCAPNGWASVGPGGIATATQERTPYRVMERLDASHIRVLIL